MEQEEYGNAAASYRQAINLSTESRPILQLALGWALQEDGRLEEAAAEYRIAERQAPDMPAVQNYLGGYHEERGELDLAEAAYRQALKLQPNFALPHARLGTLLRGKVSDSDLASLENRLTDPELKPEARGRLLFGLAHVLDARGDYVRAAATLQEANAVTLENKIGRRYSPADHERFIDNMIKFFDARYFARAARWGLASRRPVFIFGLPRSGTTLIEQVLASHSRVLARASSVSAGSRSRRSRRPWAERGIRWNASATSTRHRSRASASSTSIACACWPAKRPSA